MDAQKLSDLDEHGFAVFPKVLSAEELERVRSALDRGVETTRERFGSTHLASIDPNDANIRVNNLPAVDPVFIDLLKREDALSAAHAVLGPNILVSNFTANIALPGSGSMRLHSDQALVMPPPWLNPWAMNVIWCLDDIHATNGATRYLPGSHRFQSLEDVPANAMEQTVAFEAPAGSFIAMEGRLWHTSGCNVTESERRRMMFAYYSSDFIRQQINWAFALPEEVRANMDAATRKMFGLETMGNTRIGSKMTALA